MNIKQSENILKLEKIGNIDVKVAPHRTLNQSRGVISESEFQKDLEEDILECLKSQKVIAVRRITIKRNGLNLPTKHLILTFDTPVLPKSVKIAYINCPVKHFIPNPLRCFKCQKFGHTITACRGKQICARCSSSDHESNTCNSTEAKSYNCDGDHPSYSRSCPHYKLEKEILTVKITKNLSFPDARKIVADRTPKPNLSYASALNPSVSPSQQTTSATNNLTSTTTANTPVNNELITIKKSDWLELLAIKKSWENASSSPAVSHATTNSTPVLEIQPNPPFPTISNDEQANASAIPTNNLLDIKTASNKSPSNPNISLSTKNNSFPVKTNSKSARENKKMMKKSNDKEKVKESKSSKRVRLLANKRDQNILNTSANRSPTRQDFLKDSGKKNLNDDGEDSDSLFKVHPSEDEMSTSEAGDF
ncbi:uncharacterized protein LOC129962977 [Argiope bruennichi]|uniref:uncharacterized protein LOC129962977 n=1 Tax=Argiope bruennichi TaxID=94029 RepID=UPI002494D9F2|nr:uncharacterized protein LOC129962977 [Argiope bruennichi]